MIHRILVVVAVGWLAAAGPAQADPPPILPFHTNYTYWDHHWIQWLPDHPRYEAIEASIVSDPADRSRQLLRVWFTERAPPKAQTYFFNDETAARAQRGRSFYRRMEVTMPGTDGHPRALELRFRDDSDAEVHWQLTFPRGAPLGEEWSGLKPQGGHAADAVFLLWHIGANATTTASMLRIGGVPHTASPEQVARAGLHYGAAYSRGIHAGVFNYGGATVTAGDRRVASSWADRTYVADEPASTLYRSQPFGYGNAGRIELDASEAGDLRAYRHVFGTHGMLVRFDPPLPREAMGAAAHRYAISFDDGGPVLHGTVQIERAGSDTVLSWRPAAPDWARSVPLRTTLTAGDTAGGYRLDVTRVPEVRLTP